LAREYGRDDAMARLLLIKEIRQAQAQGIDPASLYKRPARKVAGRQFLGAYCPSKTRK
jgi:hypothetical protein